MELWKITGVANDSVAHELHNICHHSAESSTLLYKNSQRISEVLKDQFLASGFLLLTEPQMPLCTRVNILLTRFCYGIIIFT